MKKCLLIKEELAQIRKLLDCQPIKVGLFTSNHWSNKLIRALFTYYLNIFNNLYSLAYSSLDLTPNNDDLYNEEYILSENDKIIVKLFTENFKNEYVNYLRIFNEFLAVDKDNKLLYLSSVELYYGIVIIKLGPEIVICDLDKGSNKAYLKILEKDYILKYQVEVKKT